MLIKRFALRFMSDKLQFVVCCETSFHRSIDKLKFIGHLLVIFGLSTVCARRRSRSSPGNSNPANQLKAR